MQVIAKGRAEGKTYDLVRMSAETGKKIICNTHSNAAHIMRTADEQHVKIPTPLIFVRMASDGEVLVHPANCAGLLTTSLSNTETYLIDDAEYILNKIFHSEIDTITCTPSAPPQENKEAEELVLIPSTVAIVVRVDKAVVSVVDLNKKNARI